PWRRRPGRKRERRPTPGRLRGVVCAAWCFLQMKKASPGWPGEALLVLEVVGQVDAGLAGREDVVRVQGTLDGVLQTPLHIAVALRHALLERGVDAVHGVAMLLELVQQFAE